jgi:RNA polymerase sigma factor (sigma-70 family)
MARPNPSRRRVNEYLAPAVLRRRMPEGGGDSAKLWDDFRDTGNPAARQALIEYYAPLAMLNAAIQKRRWPALYTEPLEEIQSDGLLGLIKAIDAKPYHGSMQVRDYLAGIIRRTIRREKILRSWMGRRLQERQSVIERMRGELLGELGRMPTPGEMTERLAGLITNPDLRVCEQKRMHDASQTKFLRNTLVRHADTREPRPERRAMEREVMELAAHKLCAADRSVLKMILRGKGLAAIGREIGICKSAAADRVNGLLWTLRCRADLAMVLDVEPAADVPKSQGHTRAISCFPPARLAM